MKIWLSLLGALWLGGCSTLNEQDCRQGDWLQIGIRDGRFGEPASLLQEHQAACRKYGSEIDQNAYLAGREQGLQAYCDLNNAFRLGLNGSRYKGTCPRDTDLAFTRYNQAALTVYELRNQLRATEEHIARESRASLIGPDSLKKRAELRSLERQRFRQQDELQMRQHELERLMQEARSSSPRMP